MCWLVHDASPCRQMGVRLLAEARGVTQGEEGGLRGLCCGWRGVVVAPTTELEVHGGPQQQHHPSGQQVKGGGG